MLLGLIIFGILGIIVFHNIPAIVYMLVLYTMTVTFFYIEDKIESRD